MKNLNNSLIIPSKCARRRLVNHTSNHPPPTRRSLSTLTMPLLTTTSTPWLTNSPLLALRLPFSLLTHSKARPRYLEDLPINNSTFRSYWTGVRKKTETSLIPIPSQISSPVCQKQNPLNTEHGLHFPRALDALIKIASIQKSTKRRSRLYTTK